MNILWISQKPEGCPKVWFPDGPAAAVGSLRGELFVFFGPSHHVPVAARPGQRGRLGPASSEWPGRPTTSRVARPPD